MNFKIIKVAKYKFRLEHMIIPFFLVFVFVIKPFIENNRGVFLLKKVQKGEIEEKTKKIKNKVVIESKSEMLAQQNIEEKEQKLTKASLKPRKVLLNDLSSPQIAIHYSNYTIDTEFVKWLTKTNVVKMKLDSNKNFPAKSKNFNLFFPLYQKSNELVFIETSFHQGQGNQKKQLNFKSETTWYTKPFAANESTYFNYELYLKPSKTKF